MHPARAYTSIDTPMRRTKKVRAMAKAPKTGGGSAAQIPSLRGTALRLGARGGRVRLLQSRLMQLGFDPGPEDGLYGYLTFAAVRDLQRALGLPADGTAGRRVLEALADPTLQSGSRPFFVAEVHESLGAGAASRLVGRLADVLQGVGGAARARGAPEEADARDGDARNGDEAVAGDRDKPGVPVLPDRSGGSDDPGASNAPGEAPPALWRCLHTRSGDVAGHYDGDLLRRLLHRRPERQALAGQALEWAWSGPVEGGGAPGRCLYLDLGSVSWGDGGLVLRMLRRLAPELRARGTKLALSVPLPVGPAARFRVLRALDPGAVAAAADFLVLVPPATIAVTPEPRPPSPADIDGGVRDIVADVPAWRCVLLVPLGAMMFDVGPEKGAEAEAESPAPVRPVALSYQQAMALAYTNRTRPQWDESVQRPVFRGNYRGRPVVVWMENRDSLPYKLAVPPRRRLAGAYLHGLGLEDGRIWSRLRRPPFRAR